MPGCIPRTWCGHWSQHPGTRSWCRNTDNMIVHETDHVVIQIQIPSLNKLLDPLLCTRASYLESCSSGKQNSSTSLVGIVLIFSLLSAGMLSSSTVPRSGSRSLVRTISLAGKIFREKQKYFSRYVGRRIILRKQILSRAAPGHHKIENRSD